MTLGLAPTQGDLLRSTVSYCEGADQDSRAVQEPLDPYLLGVLGQGERVFSRCERRGPGTKPELDLGQGTHRKQSLGRHLGVAHIADRGEVATGADQVVGRDP